MVINLKRIARAVSRMIDLRSVAESLLSRRVRWLIAGAAMIIAAILAVNALVLMQTHQAALNEVETSLLRQSLALSELTDRTLQAVAVVLVSAADKIRPETSADRDLGQFKGQETYEFLKERVSELPQIETLAILNANGDRVNYSRAWPSSDIDLSYREYFQQLKKNPRTDIFVGGPIMGYTTRDWVIVVARPVLSQTGDFLGVVAASVVLQYFEELFRATSIGDGYAAKLLREDGTLLVRYPAAGRIGMSAPISVLNRMGRSGVAREISPTDHMARIATAYRLTHFPLVVVTSQTEHVAFAMWRSMLATSILISLVLISIILAAAYLVARSWKQQDQLAVAHAQVVDAGSRQALAEAEMKRQKELAEHAARFNAAVENMPQGLCMFDAAHRLIVCNQRYREMYGLTRDQTKPGTTLQSILEARAATPGSPKDVDAYIQRRLQMFGHDQPHYVEDELCDGRIIAVSNQLMPKGGWIGVHQDITERKQAAEHQARLIAELDHRVKNILARVAVVAMYTRQGSHSMDELVRALDGRIQSMADAHALLSQSHWRGVSLVDLVRRQLAPYTTETNVVISGPDNTLPAAATQAVAMVLHELVTNAVKYGSLSSPDGRVSVNLARRDSADGVARVVIGWREAGGPGATKAPSQTSYGTKLIRNLVPHELGGAVDLMFAPEGLRCDIEIPVNEARITN
jgi:PAS domain S-box-containing protein